ncbi:MAG: hypothetical protein AB1831_01965 [Pseudomonadota bacterium]
MAVYVGFTGTAHVLQGLACFLVESCREEPRTFADLADKAVEAFEIEAGLDLGTAIAHTVRQLRGLGILMPCPQPS